MAVQRGRMRFASGSYLLEERQFVFGLGFTLGLIPCLQLRHGETQTGSLGGTSLGFTSCPQLILVDAQTGSLGELSISESSGISGGHFPAQNILIKRVTGGCRGDNSCLIAPAALRHKGFRDRVVV